MTKEVDLWKVSEIGTIYGLIMSDNVRPLDVMRELLSNAVDHGNAKEVNVKFDYNRTGKRGLIIEYKEMANGMDPDNQDAWFNVNKKTFSRDIEMNKGRGAKSILKSSFVEIETVYKDEKTKTNKKWHIQFPSPYADVQFAAQKPTIIMVTDNEPTSEKETFLRYTIKDLNVDSTHIWADLSPSKVKPFLAYHTKALDKRVMFNDACKEEGQPEFSKGPKVNVDLSAIMFQYTDKSPSDKVQGKTIEEISKFNFEGSNPKEKKAVSKYGFAFPADDHSATSYPSSKHIGEVDKKEGCRNLSKLLPSKLLTLTDTNNRPIGKVFLRFHVGGRDVTRPYLDLPRLEGGSDSFEAKKDYMGVYLMKNGVGKRYTSKSGSQTVLGTEFQNFQAFAECLELTATEGRNDFVDDDILKACLTRINAEFNAIKKTEWFTELSNARKTVNRGYTKKAKKKKIGSGKGEEEEEEVVTDEWDIAERVHDGTFIKDRIDEGKLEFAPEKIRGFYPFRPHNERMMENLLYRLSCESRIFPYNIDLFMHPGQDVVAHKKGVKPDKKTGRIPGVVGECKILLSDIMERYTSHDRATLTFVVVWEEDEIDPKSKRYSKEWIYDKKAKVIRHTSSGKTIEVIVLPDHISDYQKDLAKYLESQKSK